MIIVKVHILDHKKLGSVGVSLLHLPPAIISANKAEGAWFSGPKGATDNTVSGNNSHGPSGWTKKALLCVTRRLFRLTKLLSSCLG